MSIRRTVLLIIAWFILLLLFAIAHAQERSEAPDKTLAPYFFVDGDPSLDQLPLKSTQVDARIAGVTHQPGPAMQGYDTACNMQRLGMNRVKFAPQEKAYIRTETGCLTHRNRLRVGYAGHYPIGDPERQHALQDVRDIARPARRRVIARIADDDRALRRTHSHLDTAIYRRRSDAELKLAAYIPEAPG